MMNQNTLLVFKVFLLLGFAFMATPSQAQNKPAETTREVEATHAASELAQARRAIAEGNATAVKAWATGDASMFASLFIADALELRPDGSIVKGREKIVDLTKASMLRLGPGVELTVETTGVWLEGDTAYETGKSIYKYKEKGQAKTFETLFVSIWKKQRDNTWKIVVDMPVPQLPHK